MDAEADVPQGNASNVPLVSVPDLRDYHLINKEVETHLNAGRRRVRLIGVERQRLLLSGLAGPWDAVVDVEGDVGPEFAEGLCAPNVTVICRGNASDGLGLGMEAGFVVVLGDAGPAVGYAMRGGTLVVKGRAGPRAGLNQVGGELILLGSVGGLAGERQSGGLISVVEGNCGPFLGRGRRGGELLLRDPTAPPFEGLDPMRVQRLDLAFDSFRERSAVRESPRP
ncbi:MAG: glutamate synthase [Isosphaeraceae bacterium]